MNTLYTIGYEGTDIDRLIATLKAVGVTLLADVRAVAASRKKGFSKNGLREKLAGEGIEYVHLVELGDPKPGRDAARAGKIGEFRQIYSAHLETAGSIAALKVLQDISVTNSVCLLCFERNPSDCHRTIVASRLKTRGFNIFDLYGDEPARYVRHAEKLPRNHSRQGHPEP